MDKITEPMRVVLKFLNTHEDHYVTETYIPGCRASLVHLDRINSDNTECLPIGEIPKIRRPTVIALIKRGLITFTKRRTVGSTVLVVNGTNYRVNLIDCHFRPTKKAIKLLSQK